MNSPDKTKLPENAPNLDYAPKWAAGLDQQARGRNFDRVRAGERARREQSQLHQLLEPEALDLSQPQPRSRKASRLVFGAAAFGVAAVLAGVLGLLVTGQ
jgi:hypothetical protein